MTNYIYLTFSIIFILLILLIIYFVVLKFIEEQQLRTVGDTCTSSEQCKTPLICADSGTCQPNNNSTVSTIDHPCDSQNCSSGSTCLPLTVAYCNSNGVCQCGTGGGAGATCQFKTDCQYGYFCNSAGICAINASGAQFHPEGICNDNNCQAGQFCNYRRNCQGGEVNLMEDNIDFILNPSMIFGTGLIFNMNEELIYSDSIAPLIFNYNPETHHLYLKDTEEIIGISKEGLLVKYINMDNMDSLFINLWQNADGSLFLTDIYGNSSKLDLAMLNPVEFVDPKRYQNIYQNDIYVRYLIN